MRTYTHTKGNHEIGIKLLASVRKLTLCASQVVDKRAVAINQPHNFLKRPSRTISCLTLGR